MRYSAFKFVSDASGLRGSNCWMVGRWEGTGHGTDHEGNDFQFEQRMEFQSNGEDYLYYVSQTFLLDDDADEEPSEDGIGRATKVLGMPRAVVRLPSAGTVEE